MQLLLLLLLLQDRHGWEQQTDSPTATCYGFRLVCQHAADHLWDLLHLDLKTAFLQGEHYNLSQRTVAVQLPNDIGLPPWMVGLCMRPVYGLNDAPRRWWNRLDKFLRAIGLEPTRADRCTYVCYQGTEGKNVKINSSKLASHDSCFSSEEVESETVPQNSCFSSEKEKGLKDKGWFPFLGGHANVAHRAKALRSTWWVLERATDLRIENKPVFLEEEAAIVVSLFLPEKKAFATDQTPQLTPELVDELLEHFVDPVHGSNSKGRLSVGCLSLHVDDLIITGSPKFLAWFLESIKKRFTVGHEDRNDLMFTGQRVKWILDEKGNKKYISIDQSLNVSELEGIVIPKNLKDDVKCDKALHTSYRSLLGSINWLQSRTQFQACYKFSRLASASASPTIGNCKELNKLCRSIKQEPADMRIWPLKSKPRILGIPDAAFRNNSDKSSQRAMTIFMAEDRVKGKRDTRGSLVFFESTKIKRTTLSTTVAELYALMKCFGTCQMLRGLWKDITGLDAEIHIRTDANNLVSAASTTHIPEQQETIHMIQMLRKEACSGAISDLSHVRTERCLSDCLTKQSANIR
ncbi:GIP [Symbiodinium sp. CCMP2456]|nr:GIP [Symbiodinium sp. CCMP2456]